MLLLSAMFIIFTHDGDITFSFSLFPIGMIISGLGSFLHGPMDTMAKSLSDLPVSERVGVVILFIGMVCMLLAAAAKFFGL